MCVCMCMCMCAWIHIHSHPYVCVRVCVRVRVHVCITLKEGVFRTRRETIFVGYDTFRLQGVRVAGTNELSCGTK